MNGWTISMNGYTIRAPEFFTHGEFMAWNTAWVDLIIGRNFADFVQQLRDGGVPPHQVADAANFAREKFAEWRRETLAEMDRIGRDPFAASNNVHYLCPPGRRPE